MSAARREIRVAADAAGFFRLAAETFRRAAEEAIRARGRFAVALSGGHTPKSLYALLADPAAPFRAALPWDRTHFFWGDERHVPPDHPDSNYRMARDAMLSRAPVPPGNIHRIAAESPDAGIAAEGYEKTLRAFFSAERPGAGCRFDLVLLGLGPDGHTASLFPGVDALRETARLVAAPWVEKLGARRITLTPPAINGAAEVLFLVGGADKAAVAREVLEGSPGSDRLPAQLIAPSNGKLLWLLDRPAAGLLRVATRS